MLTIKLKIVDQLCIGCLIMQNSVLELKFKLTNNYIYCIGYVNICGVF